MNHQDIEMFLTKGNVLGFIKQTGSDEFVGRIWLTKSKPDERLNILFPPTDSTTELPRGLAGQQAVTNKPYVVNVVEINRQAYENDDYETNEDYRINEVHFFSTLSDVENFIEKFGCDLSDIKWPIEIEST